MPTPLDPITLDLIFTVTACFGLIISGAATIAALPWTAAEIAETERAFCSLLSVDDTRSRRARVAR